MYTLKSLMSYSSVIRLIYWDTSLLIGNKGMKPQHPKTFCTEKTLSPESFIIVEETTGIQYINYWIK